MFQAVERRSDRFQTFVTRLYSLARTDDVIVDDAIRCRANPPDDGPLQWPAMPTLRPLVGRHGRQEHGRRNIATTESR
jgi:hypothetical protein